jgi:tetratricopeptide (TPR) repeat protein
MDHVSEKFQNAQALHRKGLLASAQALYEEIIRLQPTHFGATHFLGLIAAQSNQPERAVALMAKSLEFNDKNAVAYNNHGNALVAIDRYDEAIGSYDKALRLNPRFVDAYYNRALAFLAQNKWHAAVDSCDEAIALDRTYADAHKCRADALARLKQLEAALASYDEAIKLRPEHAAAHCNRGFVLQEIDRLDAALESYDKAILFKANYADAYANRGTVLQKLGRLEAALASFDQAIAIRPDFALAYTYRGTVLRALRQWDSAVASHDRAIAIAPKCAEAFSNKGVVLRELGRLEPALASFEQAIFLQPEYAEAHSNRGVVLHEMMQVHAAIASYTKAIAIKPDYAAAYENRALSRLLLGDWENGWQDYEWRWKNKQGTTYKERRAWRQPRWRGDEPIETKTILLHSEQGLGDTLQFCRYATSVAKLAAKVVLEVQRPLKALLAGLDGVAQVIARGDELPEFDYSCPLLSMPFVMKTMSASIPANVPYLRAHPEKLKFWNDRLGPKTKPRIGLVWSGGFRAEQPELWSVNTRRNVPLAKLAPLKLPGVEFYSLQKGQPAESELSQLVASRWDGPELLDHTGLLHDFADTAALIEHLDLVISVDTSTAHLAGALGKPVWILNRFDSCWRWLLDRTDSPWYPTAKLYRQDKPGDWDGVIERVKQDLMRLPSRIASQSASRMDL